MQQDIIRVTETYLSQFSDRQKVMRKLIRQINKDFGSFLAGDLPEDAVSTEKIVEVLIPVLKNLQSDSKATLRQLLYKIDMDERSLFEQLQDEDPDEHPQIMAWSIVERELKKVVTRIYFSENKDAFRDL